MAAKRQIITESLIAFCVRAESEAQPLTVCRVTHPDAIDGDVYEGTYAGFPLVKGATAEALLSDGSYYPPRNAVPVPDVVVPAAEQAI